MKFCLSVRSGSPEGICGELRDKKRLEISSCRNCQQCGDTETELEETITSAITNLKALWQFWTNDLVEVTWLSSHVSNIYFHAKMVNKKVVNWCLLFWEKMVSLIYIFVEREREREEISWLVEIYKYKITPLYTLYYTNIWTLPILFLSLGQSAQSISNSRYGVTKENKNRMKIS